MFDYDSDDDDSIGALFDGLKEKVETTSKISLTAAGRKRFRTQGGLAPNAYKERSCDNNQHVENDDQYDVNGNVYKLDSSSAGEEEEFSECLPSFFSAKCDTIHNALKSKDVRLLKECCWTHGGLLFDDNRISAWPLLIGVDSSGSPDSALFSRANECSFHKQIELDVMRTLSRFSSDYSEEARTKFQESLIQFICVILLRNPELNYYQGYHDVCLTFMMVHGKQCLEMVEKITLSHFKEFMEPTMEKTTLILNDLMPLVDVINQEVAEHMYRSGVGVIFALSWIITWFSHVLDELPLILRLYDVFICSHRLTPLYIAAEIISINSERILSEECDMPSLHKLLTRLPSTMTMEQLDRAVESASLLQKKHPPSSLSDLAASWKKRCRDIESRQEEEFKRLELEASMKEIHDKERYDLFTRVLLVGMTIGVGAVATVFMYNHVQRDPSMLLDDFLSLIYGGRQL